MSLTPDLDTYRATEGIFTVETEPPSCSHTIWVWQRQCRECGIAEGPFEDVDRRPLL